jgi:hypothetical protein
MGEEPSADATATATARIMPTADRSKRVRARVEVHAAAVPLRRKRIPDRRADLPLKDIHELLMDTGLGAKAYAIIEQGKIGMILSSRPTDRRS